jgi:hypothetical protein
MKVKTIDQVHVSSVQAGTIPPNTTIEVSDEVGKSLVDRGLATKIAAAPKNKAAPKSKNKSR